MRGKFRRRMRGSLHDGARRGGGVVIGATGSDHETEFMRRIIRLLCVCALTSAICASVLAAADVEIARDGKLGCAIWIRAQPKAGESLAAEELAKYLHKMVGGSEVSVRKI